MLTPIFPGCRHVAQFGLLTAGDPIIHAHARAEGLTILSKDDDFRAMIERAGPPPKLLFIRLGNVSTREIATAIIAREADVRAFLAAPSRGIMVISS